MLELNKIYNENCLDTISRMPDNFLDLVVTSPPYDNLRDYNGYFIDYDKVISGLYRVMKQGGVIVWVVGDATVNGSETGSSFEQVLKFRDAGFKIHDTMIYEKNSPSYPAGAKSNRYSQVFEFMFILSKGKPKTANLLKDRKNKYAGTYSWGKSSNRQKDGILISQQKPILISDYSYRFNIWKLNTGHGFSTKDKIAFKHPAIFPESLASDHIKTWSNIGDIVYDPFMGSGTTAKMAIFNSRKYIGSEISVEYCDIIKERLKSYNNILC